MELDKNAINYNQYPSKYEMELMSDSELFELANQNKKFRKIMVSFISSLRFKPILVENSLLRPSTYTRV